MSTHYTDRELGTAQVILNDFKLHRIPRLLAIKEGVDKGEVVNEFDLQFLQDVLEETRGVERFADKHPEWQKLVAEVFELYHHITETDLKNENNGQNSQ